MRMNSYCVVRKVWMEITKGIKVQCTIGTKLQARNKKQLKRLMQETKWSGSTVYYINHNGN